MGKRIFIGSFIFMFVCFLALYIIGLTGYFDYKQYEKTKLTKENMEKFENDVNEGKQVDIKDYMQNDVYDYNNNISKIGLDISNNIEKYTKMLIGGAFKAFDKVVE